MRDPRSAKALPPEPKVGSSVPLALYLAEQRRRRLARPARDDDLPVPLQRGRSSAEPAVTTLPPVPNVASSEPFTL